MGGAARASSRGSEGAKMGNRAKWSIAAVVVLGAGACPRPRPTKRARRPSRSLTTLGTLHRKTSAISDRHPTFATGSQKRRRFISSAVLGCNWIWRILMPAAAAVRQPSQSAKRQSEWPVLNRAPLLCGCTSTGVRMPDQTPHQVVDISSWPLDEEFGIFPWHQPCPPGEKRAQD